MLIRFLFICFLISLGSLMQSHAMDNPGQSKYIKECQHVDVEEILLTPKKYNEKIICGIALLSEQRSGFGLQKLSSKDFKRRSEETINLEIFGAEEVELIKTFSTGEKVFFLGKLHFFDQCSNTIFYRCKPDEKLFELDLNTMFSLEQP